MAHQHVETNPHFIDPQEITPEQRHYLPVSFLPRRGHDHRIPHPQNRRPQPRHSQDERPHPLGPSPPEPHHEPHLPPHHEDQRPQSQPQHRQGQQLQPPSSIERSKKQKRQRRPHKEVTRQPQLQDQNPSASLIRTRGEITEDRPSPEEKTPGSQGGHPHMLIPPERRTKAPTWFAAAFCIIFWLILITGALVVLIVYLIFRPRSPRFDVNSVTLNAAYLDMGYLLNADLSVLANFTNPNKKVSVDFSYMYLDLYFEDTRIATQYIEPFSAAKGQSMFANIHMLTSQVRLSMKETLLLQKQIENNRVMFTVKGAFRARSHLGGFLKYSYWLHGYCRIMVSSPPSGVIRRKRCRTKH